MTSMLPITTWNTIVFITLDSLRYDTACEAETPNFHQLLHQYTAPRAWVRTFTQGTYTLPAHISMFLGGKFPSAPDAPFPHRDGRLFSLASIPGRRSYFLEVYRQQGFQLHGFGSVGWFNPAHPTVQFLWPRMFDTFQYQDAFNERSPDGFDAQLSALAPSYTQSVLFVNIGSTHFPYRTSKTRLDECTRDDQRAALEYVDARIWSLLNRCARPTQVYITGDHGDCFGEDGRWGHGFYHPKVMEVPSLYAELF